MTTTEVANRFSELSKTQNYPLIYSELYADNCASIEPANAPFPTVEGMTAIHEKGKQFQAMIEEMYGGYQGEPIVGGNFFSVAMGMDLKMKGMPRMNFDEIAVYEVKDGKIVKEQFFF
jgi:hypothetical protein